MTSTTTVALILGLAALGLATAIARSLRLATDPLGRLVADCLGKEIARKGNLDESEVRRALASGQDVRGGRLGSIVRTISCQFSRQSPGAAAVDIELSCHWQDNSSTTTETTVPWENLPADVRSEFVQIGSGRVTRSWMGGG